MNTSRPNRRQLRRHARKLRRDGFQPMMVINPGDPSRKQPPPKSGGSSGATAQNSDQSPSPRLQH